MRWNRYKSGRTKEAETDNSDRQSVHVFYNREVDSEYSLPSGENLKRVAFIMAMGKDYDRTLADFNEGKVKDTCVKKVFFSYRLPFSSQPCFSPKTKHPSVRII